MEYRVAAIVTAALQGCTHPPPSPNTAAPQPPAVAALPGPAIVVDEEHAQTTPALAAPKVEAPKIPPELESAPAHTYRELMTGRIRAWSTLKTYTLRRHGDEALLVIAEDSAKSDGTKGPMVWSPVSKKTFSGKVETSKNAVVMSLRPHEGGEAMTLRCEPGNIAAAAATAVRRARPPGPNSAGCDGERGHWVPGAMKRIDVLRCFAKEEDFPDPDRKEQFAFTTGAGVEWLYVNDDCVMQGGGYRAIAPDGAVAKFR